MDKFNLQINGYFRKLSFFLIFTAFYLLFFIVPVLAAGLNISLDKTKITLDEQIEITITASGGKPSDPDIPSSQDYEISYRGSSTQVQIINGAMSESQTYTYSLTPKNTGKFTIGPITADIDGQKYSTNPVQIEVRNQEQIKNEQKNAELFITAQVNNLHPYLNQQVIYTFRFFRKISTGNNEIKYPDFKGFWVDNFGKETKYEQIINGERYVISEVRKALYPTDTGNVDIKSTHFVVEYLFKVDDGFGGIFSQTRTELKRFTTNPIRVTVKPLPPNKPSDFNGLVGSKVSLSANLNQSTAKAGDSITFSLTLKGKGNVNDLKTPELKIKDNFKIYEDKPAEKSYMKGEELFSEKTFKYAIVPLKAGIIKIPPVKITYFNTLKNRYDYVISTSFNLKVSQSDEGTVQNLTEANKKIDVKIIGEDIFSIHEELDSLKQQGLNFYKKVFYLIWFFIPVIIYVLIYFFSSGKIKSFKMTKTNDKKRFKNYLSKINELELNIEKNHHELPEKLSGIFSDYLTHKYNINPQTIITINPGKQKNGDGLPAELAKEVSDLFEKYEYLKFSGNSISLAKKKEILVSTKELLNRLELPQK